MATVKGATDAESALGWGNESWMMARAKKLFSTPLSTATVLHAGRGSLEILAKEYPNDKPKAGTRMPNRSTSRLAVFKNTDPILKAK